MDFFGIIEDIVLFAQGNLIITAGAAIVIILLIWYKPKLVLSILGIALILWFSIYLIMSAASLGKTQKKELIEKGEELIERVH